METLFSDKRGTLIFPIKNLSFNAKECTVSVNKKNVFRGIHINNFEKLVTCIQGKILDIIINIETGEIKYYNLLPGDQITVPKNHGHSFLSLEENSILIYHFNEIFDNNSTKFLHYSNFNLKLPDNIIISDKDNKLT
jgi:dTDP-4-dehydrorhamnose 3,5-epimerase-like enzyme